MIKVPNDQNLDVRCQIVKQRNPQDLTHKGIVVKFRVEDRKFEFNFPANFITDENVETKLTELRDTAIQQYYQILTAVPVGNA